MRPIQDVTRKRQKPGLEFHQAVYGVADRAGDALDQGRLRFRRPPLRSVFTWLLADVGKIRRGIQKSLQQFRAGHSVGKGMMNPPDHGAASVLESVDQ